jgi:hypothetical protein
LRVRLDDAAAGRFPPADGLVEVVPSPGGPADAIVGFTGHFVVAADIDPDEFAAHVPPGDLAAPMSPASLLWLGARLGSTATTYDALLCGIGTGTGVPPWLHEVDGHEHSRVEEAARYRDDMRVFVADDDAAVLALGRGLCGRWDFGFEVAPPKVADWVGGWCRRPSVWFPQAFRCGRRSFPATRPHFAPCWRPGSYRSVPRCSSRDRGRDR